MNEYVINDTPFKYYSLLIITYIEKTENSEHIYVLYYYYYR